MNPVTTARRSMPKLPNSEKVAWIREELGGGADLPEFSRKFLELFSEKLRGPVPQKAACLKLYSMYSSEGPWRKESDLPPKEQVAFQRVWSPEAPDKCAECGTTLPAPAEYCSPTCERAGCTTRCRCGSELDPIHPYCGACKRGAPALRHDGDKQAQADTLSLAQRLWFGGSLTKDPGHEPAWKRRRRS